MTKKNRLRFAPSPTGPLHIGGLRTALFNYLFAKKTGGELVLRVEDTDQARKVEKSQEHIENSLAWIGIDFDESSKTGGQFGPYNQSERKGIYKKHVNVLIEKGWAYYAFDKKEKLDFHRLDHEKKGKKFIYNAHNRLKLDNSLSMDKKDVEERIRKENYVVRFKTPSETNVVFNDIIRGEILVGTRDIDDKILFKSDGMPTYHLANVVDDHLMEITHVIRGEEWLPSLALHVLLYRAFDWQEPKFAHLPLILKPTGKGKLSKRDGTKLGFPVYAVEWKDAVNIRRKEMFKKGEDGGETSQNIIYDGFKESGFLPEALINYMVFLGWSAGGEKEIYSLDELVNEFTLDKINKSGAKFDFQKLLWINSQHIQGLSIDKLCEVCEPKNKDIDKTVLKSFLKLVQPRLETINNLKEKFLYLFERPTIDYKIIDKMISKEIKEAVAKFILRLHMEKVRVKSSVLTLKNPLKKFNRDSKEEQHVPLDIPLSSNKSLGSEEIKKILHDSAETHGAKFGKVMAFCRTSIVGKMEGPDVIQMMLFIGIDETVIRLKKGIKNYKA
jgi:glutamyl-tRNA synthetase